MSNGSSDAKMQYDEDMEDSDDMMSEEEEEEDHRTPEEIASAYKEEGNEFYKRELYHKAVDKYSQAIQAIPDSPVYLNNRAAAYLMLNKYEQAANDATKATKLDPSFLKGYVRAAKAFLTLGKTKESIDMYNNLLLRDPMNTTAMEGKKLADLNKKRKERGLELLKNKEYQRSNQFISLALRDMTHDSELRIAQVEIQMMQGNLDLAMELSTSLIREGVGSTKLLHLRSKIYYYQGNFVAAIKHLKQLLSGDPDNKECAKDIRAIRKLETKKKEGNDFFGKGQWGMAYTAYSECLEFDPDNKLFCAKLLCNRAAVLNKQRKFQEAVLDCNKAIKYDPTYIKAYMRRAQNNILINEIETLELAIRDYEHAKKLMGSADTREIDQSIREAKAALKQAKRKDYYKILGCDRDADAKQIKKAYRKAALKWHPDKWESSSAEDAKKAEAVFKDIGEAYAVLSDPEKKSRYDSGVDTEDLDNPMAGGHGGMDPNDIFNMFFSGGMGGMGGGGFRSSRCGGRPQGFGF